jgi:hypothetical protein
LICDQGGHGCGWTEDGGWHVAADPDDDPLEGDDPPEPQLIWLGGLDTDWFRPWACVALLSRRVPMPTLHVTPLLRFLYSKEAANRSAGAPVLAAILKAARTVVQGYCEAVDDPDAAVWRDSLLVALALEGEAHALQCAVQRFWPPKGRPTGQLKWPGSPEGRNPTHVPLALALACLEDPEARLSALGTHVPLSCIVQNVVWGAMAGQSVGRWDARAPAGASNALERLALQGDAAVLKLVAQRMATSSSPHMYHDAVVAAVELGARACNNANGRPSTGPALMVLLSILPPDVCAGLRGVLAPLGDAAARCYLDPGNRHLAEAALGLLGRVGGTMGALEAAMADGAATEAAGAVLETAYRAAFAEVQEMQELRGQLGDLRRQLAAAENRAKLLQSALDAVDVMSDAVRTVRAMPLPEVPGRQHPPPDLESRYLHLVNASLPAVPVPVVVAPDVRVPVRESLSVQAVACPVPSSTKAPEREPPASPDKPVPESDKTPRVPATHQGPSAVPPLSAIVSSSAPLPVPQDRVRRKQLLDRLLRLRG